MVNETHEKIVAKCSDEEKIRLTIAYNALMATTRQYHADQGNGKLGKQYDTDERRYDKIMTRLQRKYFPDGMPDDGERFTTQAEALRYLNGKGLKVTKGKLCQDCKKGFPPKAVDGSLSKADIDQYAYSLDAIGGMEGALPSEMVAAQSKAFDDARRAKASADIEEMKAESMRRGQSDEWLNYTDAWVAIAAFVGSIREAMRHHFDLHIQKVVSLAGGQFERGPECYEGCEELIDEAFNSIGSEKQMKGILKFN